MLHAYNTELWQRPRIMSALVLLGVEQSAGINAMTADASRQNAGWLPRRAAGHTCTGALLGVSGTTISRMDHCCMV